MTTARTHNSPPASAPESADAHARPPGEFVQSLERGLSVIRAFGPDHPSLTLSGVAHRAGISRAAARRFLHTLVELGYVASDGREFSLRPQVLELGYTYLSSLSLPEIAQPHLKRLASDVGESSSVAVLDGHDIVYVARVAAYRIMTASIVVGTRFPAFATSMGRAILGGGPLDRQEAYLGSAQLTPLTTHTITSKDRLRDELNRVRTQGWALVDQELEEGLRALAVPVKDARGRVVAAVNVSAPVRRGKLQQIVRELLPAVSLAARAIEADLKHVGTTAP